MWLSPTLGSQGNPESVMSRGCRCTLAKFQSPPAGAAPGRAHIPGPLPPAQATTSPSIACSGRGKGRGKKKFLPSIPGMRFLRARGAHSARRAPAWPSRCSGRPSPACGAARSFPGKSRTPRSAVSRGQTAQEGTAGVGWGGVGRVWGDRGRKRAPPAWTEIRPGDPRRASCKGARGAPSLRIRGGRGSRPGGPSWVGEGRGPLCAARPGMPAPRAGEAREGAWACRKRGPGRAEQAGWRRGGAAGLGRAEAPGALEGLGEAEEGRRPLDTHWTASSSRKRPWCAAGETEARAGRGALARTQLPWHRAETTPGSGPGWVTGSVPAWETNWRPRGQDVREQAGARSEAAGEARDHAHRKRPVSEGPSQAREPGGAEGDRCGAPGQGTDRV